MAHTNTGIISAPVSFADVNSVLGTSHTSLGLLCTDNNINMWAARKPIFNTKVGILTDEDWKGNGRTLSGYKTGGGIKKWANVYAQYVSGMGSSGSPASQIWAYDKPASGSAYRLHDFSGYYHNVGRAFSISTLFGNISNILIPSSDSESGRTVAFSFGFASTTPDGGIPAAQLFGDCWAYYPAVILTNGSSGSNSYNYCKVAPSPISSYAGSSVTINVDTGDFAKAIAADYRTRFGSGTNPYEKYPLRTNDNWTGCMVLLSTTLPSGSHTVPTAATIVRLEYASGVDRKTLPIKQSKWMNIEWMKYTIKITKVSGYQRMYKIDSVIVTSNVLSTTSMIFSVKGVFSTPSGTCYCGSTTGNPITINNWSSMTLSGATGEVSKTLSFSETKENNTASSSGNYLINGTLTFTYGGNSYSGGFSFDVTNQWPEYTLEVNVL